MMLLVTFLFVSWALTPLCGNTCVCEPLALLLNPFRGYNCRNRTVNVIGYLKLAQFVGLLHQLNWPLEFG